MSAATSHTLAHSRSVMIPVERDLLWVTGKHRVRFLNAMLSNATADLEPGQGTEAAFCSIKGRFLAHLRVYAEADRYLIDLEAGAAEAFVPAIEKFRVAERVRFKPVEAASVFVVGPTAWEDLGLTPLAPNQMQERDGILFLSPVWTAVPCVQVVGDSEAVRAATAACPTAPTSLFEVLRIEGGEPRFGADFGADTLLLETGLTERVVSFTKGCYPGQEIICRVESRGAVKRLAAGLRQVSGADLSPGATLHLEGEDRPVGRLTSAATSPSHGRVALGYIRAEHAASGAKVRGPGGEELVVVRALPGPLA